MVRVATRQRIHLGSGPCTRAPHARARSCSRPTGSNEPLRLRTFMGEATAGAAVSEAVGYGRHRFLPWALDRFRERRLQRASSRQTPSCPRRMRSTDPRAGPAAGLGLQASGRAGRFSSSAVGSGHARPDRDLRPPRQHDATGISWVLAEVNPLFLAGCGAAVILTAPMASEKPPLFTPLFFVMCGFSVHRVRRRPSCCCRRRPFHILDLGGSTTQAGAVPGRH
jgi:hypothetical protein